MHRVVLVTLSLLVGAVVLAACGSSKKCNPQNCSSGCCTIASNGDEVCNVGNTTALCGSGGAECIECADGQSCSLGACITPSDGGGAGGGGGGGAGVGGGTAGGTGGGSAGGTGGGTAGGMGGGTGGGDADAGMSCWTGGGMGGSGGGTGGGTPGYPAAHPPFPTSTSYGGPVLDAPKLVPITFSNYPADLQATAECFVGSVGLTTYLTTATQEYGMTGATSLSPVHLTETPGTSLTDQQIRTWLKGKIESADPAFPTPDSENLYVIFYPSSTHITYGGGHSCQDFGGYHGSTADSAGNYYAYAVIPDCGSFFNGLSEMDDITAAGSHEIIEAITDPFNMNPAYADVDMDHEIWSVFLLSEVGDLCAQDMASFYRPPGYNFEVQRTWSNVNSNVAVGGDPCVPELPGEVYFNSVPVQPDNVKMTIQGQTFTTKGIKIPIGMSRTIDLKLFSEAPTSDWQIDAVDYGGIFSGLNGQYLDLSLSKTTGNNGDTVQLTITNKAADGTGTGGSMFMLYNQNASGTTTYIGYVSAN